MKKELCIVWLALLLVVGISSMASGSGGYLDQFNARYGTTGTKLDTCTLCHSAVPARNSYGAAFGNNGHNFATIESLDSDGVELFSGYQKVFWRGILICSRWV